MAHRISKQVIATRADGTQYITTVYVNDRGAKAIDFGRGITVPKLARVPLPDDFDYAADLKHSDAMADFDAKSREIEASERLAKLSVTLCEFTESRRDVAEALTLNGMTPGEIAAIRYNQTYARRAIAILETNRDTIGYSSRAKLTKAGILG